MWDTTDHVPLELYKEYWGDGEIRSTALRIDAVSEPFANEVERYDFLGVQGNLRNKYKHLELAKYLYCGRGLGDIPKPEYLVENWIVNSGVYFLYGPSGIGKSFFAIDLALSVANGRSWHGETVKQGKSLYVVAEGAPGMDTRQKAWLENKHIDDNPAQMAWLAKVIQLNNKKDYAELSELIAGEQFDFVVIDTLAKCTVGVDEDNTKEMNAVFDKLEKLSIIGKCSVFVVHHTGKDTDRGMRGNMVLYSNAEGVIRLSKLKGN